MTEESPNSKKEYPAIYEKIVPIAIGVLILIVIAVLIYTILVGAGILSYG